MHVARRLTERLAAALSELTDRGSEFATMVRRTTDPRHGDYQVNCAMPLSKVLGQNPRQLATEIANRLAVADFCMPPEVAGPGFINLRLKDEFLVESLRAMLGDPRCGVPAIAPGKPIIIDFSSPNVAKPMHVGHIRSTVIGDALARTLRFIGHAVITDNHLGDWGTQFGIILYGYRHFGDPATVQQNPVAELARLYRLVNQLIEFRQAEQSLGDASAAVAQATEEVQRAETAAAQAADPTSLHTEQALVAARRRLASAQSYEQSIVAKLEAVRQDSQLSQYADQHPDIDVAVLRETAKLHAGDPANLALWKEFLPFCEDEINRIYARLNIQFDHTLGESFYQPMLSDTVRELQQQGLARESEGAMCVFLEQFETPMIIRKQDGAFLYATTDLATLKYRVTEFDPAEILYVVDTRQSEHFEKLFAIADYLGAGEVKLVHVNFGTVLGEDGRPMKTRSGSLIGLESLLDDAVERARQVVCDPQRLAGFDPPMEDAEQQMVAETVGIGAIKFADLSHHRTSDYRFHLDKMVALDGNTSTYVQYSYARTQNILNKAQRCESDIMALVAQHGMQLTHPAERELALMLIKFEEALLNVYKDYAPNQLADYLLETAKAYSRFNDNCPVLRAESETISATRLTLVSLTGRLLQTGLDLLGVDVVPRM